MTNLALKKLLNKGTKSLIGQNLFDKVINVELYRVKSSSKFSVTCKVGGVKPQIEVSVKLLPHHVCYQMTVRITNFSFRGKTNIRQLNVMRVTMGYQSGPRSVFTGPIFSSYQESPNPDGVTVFEGIVVGEQGNTLLNKNTYHLHFYKDKVSVKELCTKIAAGLELKCDLSSVSLEMQNKEITTQKVTAVAQNGLALLQWLNDTLFRFSTSKLPYAQATDDGVVLTTEDENTLYALWTEDTLRVIQSSLTPQEVSLIKDVVILDAVKSASFNAAVLHVQALYVPALKPGGIFYMDPVFFTGGAAMGNMLGKEVYNPDDGLYKAITVDVQFDTNGNTNNMAIMAVPCSQGAGV